jgi:hypothetical protein
MIEAIPIAYSLALWHTCLLQLSSPRPNDSGNRTTTGQCLLKDCITASLTDRVSPPSVYRPTKRLKPVSSNEDNASSLEDESGSSSSHSGSEGETSSENDAEDDKQAMLAALEAHGRAMFASLDSPLAGPSRSSAKVVKGKINSIPSGSSSTPARSELHGFEDILSGESEEDSEFEEGEGFDEDDGDDGLGRAGETPGASRAEDEEEVVVSTVVFGGDTSRRKTTANTKADFKRFMVRQLH